MAITLTNTNYNGDYLDVIYNVLQIGNETVQKGSVNVQVGIAKKRELPRASQTEDPLGAYTDGAPSSESVTTSYDRRELDPKEMTLYETFIPREWLDIWEPWQPDGDFSNLEMDSTLFGKFMELYQNGIGTQLSKLFWQGDTTLGTSDPLGHFDGIITRAIADANVIDVTPAGAITQANVVDRIQEVWAAIPDKFLEDMDFIIHMNTTDFKLLQQYNNDAKKTTVGVLDEDIKNLFLNKRIRHYQGLPKNYIVGAKATTDEMSSNLFMGIYSDVTSDNPRIKRIAENSNTWFIRIDTKADANYRVSEEIVLYSPS